MSDAKLYSVKMRASSEGRHISGAERIVPAKAAPATAAALVARALAHPKGAPDFVNVKLEQPGEIVRVKALEVSTIEARSPEEGLDAARRLLEVSGIPRVREAMELFASVHGLRGAMLVDADTLERLEPDKDRGVRVTCMDDADSASKGVSERKNHYGEAIVLATKVQNAPGIVAELCVSDDPDYVTGYVASRRFGYRRITNMKERGCADGGRIFFYRGRREDVEKTIAFLERQCVLVEDVPAVGAADPEGRFSSLRADNEEKKRSGLWRVPRTVDSPAGPFAVCGGGKLMVLSSNDYLDLANHPAVKAAAAAAAEKWGAGTGASRLVTGTQRPHVELEERLARFKGCEAALVFSTGYMANTGLVAALARKGDAVISDELNHASIIDGCRLSGAEVAIYRHGDLDEMERLLAVRRGCRRRIVVSDAVFSMDGDILDLPKFVEICRRHDAFSVIDEAHATGVVGKTGRGLAEHFGCGHPDITVGTLSKALGSSGGFVAASRLVVDYLVNSARSFIFSTSPGAASVAAASAALDILEAEPWRVEALRGNVRFFLAALAKSGIEPKTDSAIVPIPVGDENAAQSAAEQLSRRGFLIPAIRYPTVARGKAILRASLMCSHGRDDLERAARAIAEALGKKQEERR